MKDIENEIIPFRTAIEKPRLILEQISDSIREFPALAKEYDVTPAKTKTIVEMMNTVYKQLNNTPVMEIENLQNTITC